MMKFPDEQAFREKVRQAMQNNDGAAVESAFEDYAKEVKFNRQILEESKERMIRDAREHTHKMYEVLDEKRDRDSSS